MEDRREDEIVTCIVCGRKRPQIKFYQYKDLKTGEWVGPVCKGCRIV